MSTPLPLPTRPAIPAPASPSPAPRRLPGWLREPLLHFVLLGGALFLLDHALVARSDDPRRIVVGAAVDQEASQVFQAARGRAPNADELKALRKVWLDNEVLYREGLALQVDKGDPAIRERVIFKALSVVDANVKLPPVTDAVLQAWFNAHRDKYDDPQRYDFDEAALAGEATEPAVRQFVQALNHGTPGDAQAGLRVFKGRPQANVVQSYGADVAKALAAAKPGEWLALQTRDGWRAMRLGQLTPAKPGDFQVLRNVIQQDWTDATLAEQRSAAVNAMAAKYQVRYEGAAK